MTNIFCAYIHVRQAHPDGRQNESKSFSVPTRGLSVGPFSLEQHCREDQEDEAMEHSSGPSSYANPSAPVSNQFVQHCILLLCLGYVLLGL